MGCKAEDDARKRIAELKNRQREAEFFSERYMGYAASGLGEHGRFGSPPHKCREASREYREKASRLSDEIIKAEESLERMRNTRYAPSAKSPTQWVEEHYRSLLAEKNKASNADQHKEFAEKFREMEGYKNTEKLAVECDKQIYVLKERIEKSRKRQRQICVSAGEKLTVGLMTDGTVVVAGNSQAQRDTQNWRDIVAVFAGGDYVACLKSDGTAVTNHYKQDDIQN